MQPYNHVVIMNIGFDLDKIFINYPPLIPDRIIDRLYKKKSNGELLYRFPSRPEQILRKLSHMSFLRKEIKKNVSFLQDIAKEKHTLYLISSRFLFLKPETERLMKRLGFHGIFKTMFFNFENKQPHEFKNEIIKKLQLDIYVDDDFPLLKHVAKQNKNTQFFWLSNRKKPEKLTRNITAISTLSDIFQNFHNKTTSKI
ncbi:MAG: hypothetical protein HYV40_04330 [Candidatus Levybacteria bacterium]|nr:hypothetical protein [Candidatus Levybacteria bacterium]